MKGSSSTSIQSCSKCACDDDDAQRKLIGNDPDKTLRLYLATSSRWKDATPPLDPP